MIWKRCRYRGANLKSSDDSPSLTALAMLAAAADATPHTFARLQTASPPASDASDMAALIPEEPAKPATDISKDLNAAAGLPSPPSTPHSRSFFHALGIDVGGTKTMAGVVEFPSGRVLSEQV